MQIKPKSKTVLESQLSLYANEQWSSAHGARADTILSQLGRLSVYESTPTLITHQDVPFRVEYQLLGDGSSLVEPLFDKKEYSELLTQPGSKETITNLSHMLEKYEDLSTQINDLYTSRDLDVNHPSYIGSGSNNIAFGVSLNIEDKKRDVVLIAPKPSQDWSDKSRINERAVSLAKVKGIKGFEQGIALSYEPARLIVEKVKGQPIETISPTILKNIPMSHWKELIDAVKSLHGKDISLDANPDNFFYDSIEGFTVIDFGKSTIINDPDQTTLSNIGIIKSLPGAPTDV